MYTALSLLATVEDLDQSTLVLILVGASVMLFFGIVKGVDWTRP